MGVCFDLKLGGLASIGKGGDESTYLEIRNTCSKKKQCKKYGITYFVIKIMFHVF